MSDRRNKLKRAEAAASIEAVLDGIAERAGEPLVPGVPKKSDPGGESFVEAEDDYDKYDYDGPAAKDDYYETKHEDFGDEWEPAADQPWEYVVHWTNYPRITYTVPVRPEDRETVVVHPTDDPIGAAENLVDAMRKLGLEVMVRVGSSGAYKFIIERERS